MNSLMTLASLTRKFRLWPLPIALLVLTSFGTSAQRRERLIENWRPLHYDLTIGFGDQLNEIKFARTEIEVRILKENVNSIDLDFGTLAIDSVSVNSEPARYDRTS